MTSAIPLKPLQFPLRNSRLIEASAGTGKTWTIAALYIRLILQHGNNETAFGKALTPEQILVVTFTEAATEELRDRIRARLSETAAIFRQQRSASDDFMQGLLQDYADPQLWQRLAQRLDAAAQSMDEAAVHTIHGWCNRMLREHAFASGSLFSQQLQTDSQPLWLLSAQDYWRNFVFTLTAEQYQCFNKWQNTPEKLLSQIRILPQAANAARLNSPQQLLTAYLQAEQNIRQQYHSKPWQQWLDEITVLLQQGIADKKVNSSQIQQRHINNWLQALRQWSKTLQTLSPELTEKARKRLSPQGIAEGFKGEPPEHPFWQTLADMQQAKAELTLPATGLLQHASHWISARFASLQAEKAEMGFDDMLTRLRDALYSGQGERLATAIRQQFPVVLVDEFQDTDPVQYAIFDKIYALADTPAENGIFLIGDPKQAIYSFRNADIYTYLQAKQATAGRHYSLDTNFRSTDQMVGAVNNLFLKAEEYDKGAFYFKQGQDNAVPFQRVKANGLAKKFVMAGQQVAALQFAVSALQQRGTTKAVLQQQEADWLGNRIALLLTDPHSGFLDEQGDFQRLQPGDIAILVNTGTEAAIVRQALQQRQIKSVYLSERDSVFASHTAMDLLRLLQACHEPRLPDKVRTALACGLLQLDLQQLVQLEQDELFWDQYAGYFLQYQQLWQQQGILAMLHRILHDFDVPARLLQATSGGERALTDILHLAELLQQQSMQQDGQSALIRYLSDHIAQAQSDNSRTSQAELQIRLESDSKLVQIITVHKSKGLQYPLVFLPFQGVLREQRHRVTFPGRYHDEQGKLQIAYEKDTDIELKLDAERLAEDIRKLYVALTRAQFATFVSVARYSEFQQSALHYLLAGTEKPEAELLALMQQQWPYDSILMQPIQDEPQQHYQPPAITATELQYCRFPAQRQLEHWWLASYSALQYAASEPEPISAEDTAADAKRREATTAEQLIQDELQNYPVIADNREPDLTSIHLLPKGAETGTLLHNLLEQAAKTGFAAIATTVFPLYRLADNRELNLQPWLQQLAEQVFSLPQEKTFSLAGLQQYQAEPEFWFPVHQVDTVQLDALIQRYILPGQARAALLPTQLNGMVKGFIDLIFCTAGQYYVLDYKSNWLGEDHNAYAAAAMQQSILQHRYDLQYSLYLLALHKLLKSRLGTNYDYDTMVGGAVYLFLRGTETNSKGCYADKPPYAFIQQLEQLFDIGTEANGSLKHA